MDAVELNFSCPHMDRVDMGANVGKDPVLCSVSTQAGQGGRTRAGVGEAHAGDRRHRRGGPGAASGGGADAISSSNTFPSLPPIDPETLDFEVSVDGFVASGGLGGPAILPQSLAKMAEMTQAFPDRAFSGIGGISGFDQALSYFLLGCGTVQVATAAMLDHAVGPNVIATLTAGMTDFLDRHADRGWTSLDDFRGLRRGRVVAHAGIRRAATSGYRGGLDADEPRVDDDRAAGATVRPAGRLNRDRAPSPA